MRLLLHDFAGYAFPVQLSRELARRGHFVHHRFCGAVETPQGPLTPRLDDSTAFNVQALSPGRKIAKQAFFQRFLLEHRYARALAAEIERLRPDLVLSANSPSVVQAAALRASRRAGARFISWAQDLYGLAAYMILRRRLPLVGALAGRYLMRLDASTYRASDAVIAITDAFDPWFDRWGVAPAKRHVVPNWAPLDGVPPRPKANPWAAAHGLAAAPCFLYSGTLAMKHNPELLLRLAQRLAPPHSAPQAPNSSSWSVQVVSSGRWAEDLDGRARAKGLGNLRVLPFQPFEALPDVLGAADVLVAILEPEAAVFSVPSKVLSYMCAGRPILLAVPPANQAARAIIENELGLVAAPDDVDGFLAAAERLAADAVLRERLGANARRYAEQHFDIGGITDRFEAIFDGVLSQDARRC